MPPSVPTAGLSAVPVPVPRAAKARIRVPESILDRRDQTKAAAGVTLAGGWAVTTNRVAVAAPTTFDALVATLRVPLDAVRVSSVAA